MSSGYKRRDFIKNLSLGGISLNLIPPLPGLLVSYDEKVLISNDFFTVSFNSGSRRINLLRNNQNILLNNITARVNLGNRKKSMYGVEYEHHFDTMNISDEIGSGKKLIISSNDSEGIIDFIVSYTIYDKRDCVLINAECKNVSRKPLIIRSIEPVCAIKEIGAALNWYPSLKALTNGPMYYDPGMVYSFYDKYEEPAPYGPIKGGKLSPEFKYPAENRIRSWWNIGIFSGYDREGLVCGFAENKTGTGQIILSGGTDGRLSLYTESVFAEGTELGSGKSISSGSFIVNIAKDTYTALEEFADVMGNINNARKKSIINGWCSWFYTYEFVSEEEVVRNAEFASAHLKEYGMEYIQVDEGYQKYHGDWEGNERFPKGMKWLSEKINYLGLRPGIWLSPYVISEPTEVFAKHPDWLLKEADGSLLRVGPWPDVNSEWAKNENPRRYGLDISHPGAQKWLNDLFDTVANKWGYEMVKIDFVAWSLLSAHHFYDRAFSTAIAYRKGFEIIRNAIGNEKHINDCGPGPVSVGLIDSMRIESDQNYGFSEAAWKQYFLESASSGPAAAKRYYFNKRTWINDADHVCINLLSISQSQAAASLIALSGGNLISGDRLTDLDISRMEILKKVLPSFGEAAKPVDLFESDRPSVFSLPVKKPFGEWTVLGVFNAGNDIISKSISLKQLQLNPEKKYVVYDFWMERLFGEVSKNIELKVLPESVTLLSIHEKKNIPQVISTDRHVLQGAIEIDDINWDETSKTLMGVSTGPVNTSHNVLIYIPEGINWKQSSQTLYRDFNNYSIKLKARQLLKVHLDFAQEKTINWEIPFNEILK